MKKIFIPRTLMKSHLCRHCSGAGRVMCPRCEGTGSISGSKCYYCQGERMTECNACKGTGRIDD